ncbi:MAG: AmmeMemoRadiSam system radical SAM enzyme [Bacteroidales bacterium]
MREALYYKKLDTKTVQCILCPHNCKIKDQKRGICGVRKNAGSTLYSENYGLVTGLGFDPIEKKPLYHYHPGTNILSLGSIGCNLKCFFCQNWEISQATPDDISRKHLHEVKDIVNLAIGREDNLGIAYTYNEPVIFYEFMLDVAKKIKEKGLKNVVVTNGFINPEPLDELMDYIDAFSIDLKGFTNEFYRKYTKSSFDPIKETLKRIRNNGNFLEVINLIIPALNDDAGEFEEMLKWMRDHLGENTVLHISRYFPSYKSTIEPTPPAKLKEFYDMASEYLNYVYVGNIMLEEGRNTYCHRCGALLVKREGFSTRIPGLDEEGKCIHCGNKVFIR